MLGRRFGALRVTVSNGPASSSDTFYECLCDCGQVVVKRGKHLRSGSALSCGCHRRLPAGERFERLVVFGDAPADHGKNRCYTCRCDCGAITTVRGTSLTSGATRSCGCLLRDVNGERLRRERLALKHGHAQGDRPTRTWSSWRSMIKRCTDPRHGSWQRYGGRGISVCVRWRESFSNFLADMGERPEGMTLDRIDPDGNYEPGGCRWATPVEQRHNRSTNGRTPSRGTTGRYERSRP